MARLFGTVNIFIFILYKLRQNGHRQLGAEQTSDPDLWSALAWNNDYMKKKTGRIGAQN
jgi:hypothetical protein